MKKLSLILILLLSFSHSYAQEMLGIANSNYAGTNGLSLNPSSMVDSRQGMDVNLITSGVSMDNDYLFISKDSLKFFGFGRIVDLAGDRGYLDRFSISNSGETYQLNLNAIVRGPSATFNIRKNWFGITTQLRTAATFTDITAPIAKFGFEKAGLKYYPLHGQTFDAPAFNIGTMLWGEVGVSYGHEIINKDKDYLKGAITVKRLLGFASAYAQNEGLQFNVKDSFNMEIYHPNIKYGHSFDEYIDGTPFGDLINGTGWGFDLGVAYEYRPDFADKKYEMDGQMVDDPEVNHYKLRVGLSFLDLGKISFKEDAKQFDLSGANTAYWYGYDTINFENTVDFDKRISWYTFGDSSRSFKGNSYDMALPHAMSMQVDYNIYKDFYANATWVQNLKTGKPEVVATNMVSLTPRYELPWIEVAMPMSMYQYSKFRIGVALRLGSFIIGSDKLGSVIGLSNMGGMDIYSSLKFSMTRKRIKDRDGDHVSDKADKCITEAGTWATMGCPDRDHDSITDREDDCPDVFGIAKFKGCPDTDGDGIMDKIDDCPTIPGLEVFNGCPDTDGDSIPDNKDSCVTVPGLLVFHGCPDTDNDGLIDQVDSCPLVAGPASNNGCPIIIKAPEKPAEPVKVELTKEEQEVINKVFSNLEFETGKSVIRPSSFASLNELGDLLKKKPTFKLLIDGHTDNVGKAAYNLKLSENRAGAVKLYLMNNKGIDGGRLKATGYGMTKPVASNKTPEGRQKNRRVEFTIME